MAAPRRGGKTFGGQFFPERDEDDDLEPHQRQSTIAEAQFAAMEARDQQAAAAAQQQHPQTPSFMRALNRPSPSNFLTPSGHMRPYLSATAAQSRLHRIRLLLRLRDVSFRMAQMYPRLQNNIDR